MKLFFSSQAHRLGVRDCYFAKKKKITSSTRHTSRIGSWKEYLSPWLVCINCVTIDFHNKCLRVSAAFSWHCSMEMFWSCPWRRWASQNTLPPVVYQHAQLSTHNRNPLSKISLNDLQSRLSICANGLSQLPRIEVAQSGFFSQVLHSKPHCATSTLLFCGCILMAGLSRNPTQPALLGILAIQKKQQHKNWTSVPVSFIYSIPFVCFSGMSRRPWTLKNSAKTNDRKKTKQMRYCCLPISGRESGPRLEEAGWDELCGREGGGVIELRGNVVPPF